MTEDQNNSSPVPAEPAAKTSTLFSTRTKAVFALVIVLGALSYFAFLAFEAATVNYHSVAEAASLGPTPAGRQVGIKGKLVQGSFVRSPDGLVASFALHDEKAAAVLPVNYSGEIGQVFFNKHSEIILQGRIRPDGTMLADNLSVRCPSKYLTESEQAEIDARKGGNPAPPPYQPDYFSQQG